MAIALLYRCEKRSKPIAIAELTPLNFNGYWKNRLLVSNSADITRMDFDFESTVFRNWQSQSHRRYPDGYLQFNNGKTFDRFRQTISGVPKFLFDYNDSQVRVYWEVSRARTRLLDALNLLNDGDLRAATELLVQLVTPTAVLRDLRGGRAGVEAEVARHLPALGVSQLRDLTAVVTTVPSRLTLSVAA